MIKKKEPKQDCYHITTNTQVFLNLSKENVIQTNTPYLILFSSTSPPPAPPQEPSKLIPSSDNKKYATMR